MSLLQALTSRMAGTKTYAEAIDLDGTNDYLSRASDFTGNADGKTFTFSAWVWNTSSAQGDFYKSSSRFRIDITNSNLRITGQDSGANPILIYTSANFKSQVEIGTFYHVLMSIDLTNASNRHVYINDVAITGGSFGTYTNANIDFTNTAHGIGENFKGRLSHLYLDYTYRDLSVEANRRLFITADRKPAAKAGLVALSPILYLPMDDPTTAHINLGTGGNMTLNGTIARSGRGPNQYNVAYSDLDGAADYLQRSSLIGVNDGAAMTASFVINADNYNGHPFCIEQAGAVRVQFWYESETSLRIVLRNSSATILLNATAITKNHILRNTIVTVAFDLSDTAKRHIYCNGEAASVTWATYTNGSVNFSGNQVVVGARADGVSNFFNGRLGNLYFNTTYIDLSVASNLAKFVTGTGIDAKPADLGANGELPTGTAPLIYLPMYGNNAGKNYGTGGDFTVNSGPYPGARGPNEFWGNKADFDGSTGYLARTSALTGVSDGKTCSASFFLNLDTTSASFYALEGGGGRVELYTASGKIRVYLRNSSGTILVGGEAATLVATSGTTYHYAISIDTSDALKRFVYMDGQLVTMTWDYYVDGVIDFTNTYWGIGAYYEPPATSFGNGKLSEFYFTTDYIDFSLEANRLKFRDAFGNCVDLTPQIAAGTLPNPAIYMRFDPANQGLNSGTGGNFTKSGTITDGGQL